MDWLENVRWEVTEGGRAGGKQPEKRMIKWSGVAEWWSSRKITWSSNIVGSCRLMIALWSGYVPRLSANKVIYGRERYGDAWVPWWRLEQMSFECVTELNLGWFKVEEYGIAVSSFKWTIEIAIVQAWSRHMKVGDVIWERDAGWCQGKSEVKVWVGSENRSFCIWPSLLKKTVSNAELCKNDFKRLLSQDFKLYILLLLLTQAVNKARDE